MIVAYPRGAGLPRVSHDGRRRRRECGGGTHPVRKSGWYENYPGASGLPVVSFLDSTNGGLKVLHCGDLLCTTGGNTITTVDSTGDLGYYTSITVGVDGLPVVSYYDGTNKDLKVLHCGNALCNSGNTATAVDTAGDVGSFNAVTVGDDGLPVLSYYEFTEKSLKMLHCLTHSCGLPIRRR